MYRSELSPGVFTPDARRVNSGIERLLNPLSESICKFKGITNCRKSRSSWCYCWYKISLPPCCP